TRLGVELDDLLLHRGLLKLQALLRGHDVGDALLDVLKQLELLGIAVVECLGRVLGAVEHLRNLRLDDGGHASRQASHCFLLCGFTSKRSARRHKPAGCRATNPVWLLSSGRQRGPFCPLASPARLVSRRIPTMST